MIPNEYNPVSVNEKVIENVNFITRSIKDLVYYVFTEGYQTAIKDVNSLILDELERSAEKQNNFREIIDYQFKEHILIDLKKKIENELKTQGVSKG